MKRILLVVVLACLVAVQSDAATLFFLRHADDAGEGRDPLLTEVGQERAEQLAAMLAGSGIQYILSTDYHRTRDTVAPLAARLGIEVEIYDPRDPAALMEQLEARGGTGVVVGHSNTTPALVGMLGGEPGEAIGENEFDRLYIVVTDFDASVETVLIRYAVR